jgi:hypothetical protein
LQHWLFLGSKVVVTPVDIASFEGDSTRNAGCSIQGLFLFEEMYT